jgi:hypothetical protein
MHCMEVMTPLFSASCYSVEKVIKIIQPSSESIIYTVLHYDLFR